MRGGKGLSEGPSNEKKSAWHSHHKSQEGDTCEQKRRSWPQVEQDNIGKERSTLDLKDTLTKMSREWKITSRLYRSIDHVYFKAACILLFMATRLAPTSKRNARERKTSTCDTGTGTLPAIVHTL